jgi:hypothetical protein
LHEGVSLTLGSAAVRPEADVQRIARMSSEEVAASAATSLRALADTIESGARDVDPGSLGRRIDALIERLERDVGPHMGHDREREQQQRQAEYLRSARSAIADSLRAAGITPLNAPGTAEPPGREGE